MNILFVGGGRRVSLAERFQSAGINVFAYELDKNVPIGQVAHVIKGKKWTDEYLKYHLVDVMEENNIDFCLPLQDEAIKYLSIFRTDIPSIVSGYSAAQICFDKLEFKKWMGKNFPEIYPEANFYPCIIKPRFGFGSKDIKVAHSYQDIRENYTKYTSKDFIWQSYKRGTEYTVDVYFNLNGEMVGAVPRIRQRVGDGEVIDSLTEKNYKLQDIVRQVGTSLELKGPCCMQFIVKDDKVYLFEINARFGGGSILSLEAGFDMVDMIKREYFNRAVVSVGDYPWDVVQMRRVYREFFFNKQEKK